MAADLLLAPEAERDITEAYAWYEERRVGLGEEFLSAIDACIERIRRRPDSYAPVHESYRRSLPRRFPYAVFYKHTGALVTVYAVFHTARDPEKQRQRVF